MSIRRAASAVLATMALFASGCDTVERPPGVTCEKLRALKVGNTRDEVRNVLGPPRWEGAEHPNYEKPEWDYTWAYSSKQVRLFVNFLDDRLVMVSSYIRTFLREMNRSLRRRASHTVLAL